MPPTTKKHNVSLKMEPVDHYKLTVLKRRFKSTKSGVIIEAIRRMFRQTEAEDAADAEQLRAVS